MKKALFHFIYCYYKNKFSYKSPQVGVLTSYVIYLPIYLRFEIYFLHLYCTEDGTNSGEIMDTRRHDSRLRILVDDKVEQSIDFNHRKWGFRTTVQVRAANCWNAYVYLCVCVCVCAFARVLYRTITNDNNHQ